VIHPFLSPFCKNLTSIEQKDVDNAQTFDRVFNKLTGWIADNTEGEVCYCSWGDGDMRLLAHDCDYHHLEFDWGKQYLDVKKAYNKLKRKQGKPHGLKSALSRENIELEGSHHRALDDAYNLSKIFRRYIDEWGY
jgi:inhibitor of KinA sporulation pathway (predicted exonuclease)